MTETGVRRRTRQAIVQAAIAAWARDFSAPLGDVAQRAGVSRSTLHRYFVDRQALVDAALEEALRCTDDDAGDAQVPLDDPTADALEALEDLLRRMLVVGESVLFLWADPARFADHPLWQGEDDGQDVMLALIERGQQEGALDDGVPASWLLGVYYSLLYTAAEGVVNGGVSVHEAGRRASRALRRGIVPG